jgi:hypothetical protein
VSGWDLGGKYACTAFGLTSTKAHHWHRWCARPDCPGYDELIDLYESHMAPAGVELLKDGGSYLHLTWPGITPGQHGGDGIDVLRSAIQSGYRWE